METLRKMENRKNTITKKEHERKEEKGGKRTWETAKNKKKRKTMKGN